ncbi:MAG: hypothetical protein GY856_26370, partial [bacterium]|nr:hypothetical protein [bacterium]
DEIRRYADACRKNWDAYREQPNPETFRLVHGEDPAHLVKVALGEAAGHLGEPQGPPIHLRLESQIPIGSGFGSSAATAVAVADAYLALRGAASAPEELHRLSLEIERRQHGLPSGVDNATVVHGGIVWARTQPSGGFEATPIAARSPALERIRVFHSGAPAESTGTVVAMVRSRKTAEPERYEALIDRIEAATRGLRREIETEREVPERLIELIRRCEACLEALGVVPPAVRELVRRVEARGGAAKISGAGSLAGPGAGSLLVYHPEADTIPDEEFLDGRAPLDLRLGAEGLRREPISE